MKEQCLLCGQNFSNVKRRRDRIFCSIKCSKLYQRKDWVKKECKNCLKETFINPKRFKKNKTGNFFCSKICSNYYMNKYHPKKRTKFWYCKECGKEALPKRRFCSECYEKHYMVINKTIDQVCGHLQNSALKYSAIRCHARSVVKNKEKICANCSYDKHVEVCHIRDITDFPSDTLISEVNNENNLVLLCPNCHWEFDHGLLSLTN